MKDGGFDCAQFGGTMDKDESDSFACLQYKKDKTNE